MKMKIYCSFVIVFTLFFVQTISSQPSSAPMKNVNSSKYEYKIKFLEVPLDHFSFAVNTTFKMRYLINDTWQKGNDAPIFLYTGNEGLIEDYAQNTGFMWDIAPQFGALLVFAEHRYYGESSPFKNDSNPKNLAYLKSQQAIADYVDLVYYLKSEPKTKNSPVIAFGGSLGGMLSAWMRIKYPHVVQGAIASSAPILHFSGHIDCESFSKIITSDFRRANPTCPKLIRNSWSTITNFTSTPEGLKWLSENWNLCQPLTDATNVSTFKYWLQSIYQYLAMTDYPYETNFLTPLPANPISAMCKHLGNSTLPAKPFLLTLFKAISVFTNYTGETKCHNISKATSKLAGDTWNFQSCTELVIPLCTDGINDMFEPIPWNAESVSYWCLHDFKVKPQLHMPCKEYGCTDLSGASNIVFSNGMLDPWSSGGILKNISSTVVALVIPDAAHHLELRSAHPNDPPGVKEARKTELYYISNWIKEYRLRTANNTLSI